MFDSTNFNDRAVNCQSLYSSFSAILGKQRKSRRGFVKIALIDDATFPLNSLSLSLSLLSRLILQIPREVLLLTCFSGQTPSVSFISGNAESFALETQMNIKWRL